MKKCSDLTNQKFGKLTAVKLVQPHINPSGRKRTQWLCQCDCGNTLVVLAESLKSGNTKSCGCIRVDNGLKQTEALIGTKFGKLTVIKRVPDDRNVAVKKVRYECLCECGKTTIITGQHLKSGVTNSCGCIKSPNIVGKKFGKLTVIDRVLDTKFPNKKRYINKCLCECGGITYVKTENLNSGEVQSCGCLLSKGESKINNWLKNNNYLYKIHYHVPNMLYSNHSYPYFDFAIFDNNKIKLLIEYQGTIHYYYKNSGWNTKESFKQRQIKDQEKRKLCQQFNIPLEEIPYWDFDNIELILNTLMSKYNINTAKILDEIDQR